MRTFLFIVVIHAVLLGGGFLIAGWMSLLMAEADEEAKFNEEYRAARRKSWLEGMRYFSQFRSNFTSTGRISANWTQRADARMYVYAGAALIALSVIIGSWL